LPSVDWMIQVPIILRWRNNFVTGSSQSTHHRWAGPNLKDGIVGNIAVSWEDFLPVNSSGGAWLLGKFFDNNISFCHKIVQ
jgi:hypothetical protein